MLASPPDIKDFYNSALKENFTMSGYAPEKGSTSTESAWDANVDANLVDVTSRENVLYAKVVRFLKGSQAKVPLSTDSKLVPIRDTDQKYRGSGNENAFLFPQQYLFINLTN